MPDLILLDGGKGQVAAVKEVLQSKNIDVPLFGLVKDDKHRTRAVTGEGGEIALSPGRSLFAFLAKCRTRFTALQSAITIQDEAKIHSKARLQALRV